ncbi:MAG: transposase [Clostridiaceae bacterium]
MARCARIKSPSGIDHVIIKGITECILFTEDSDKVKYIELIEKYKKIHPIEIYTYCFMSTHAHFIIDSSKSNLSMFMKSVNQSYASYYNKKYNRIGPVFFDRFKSIPILTKKQTKNVSLYIHRNPKDIKGYRHNTEKYKYSSLAVFIGLIKDKTNILSPYYVLNCFDHNMKKARRLYKIMMNQDNKFIDSDRIKEFEMENQKSLYSSDKREINPSLTPDDIIEFVRKYTGKNFTVFLQYDRENRKYISLSVLLIRSFCCFTYKKIAEILGNTTSSNVSKLCKNGVDLVTSTKEYATIMEDLCSCHAL